MSDPRRPARANSALRALALGAMAVGAFAVGALAINWLAVRRLKVGRAEIGSLKIDDLTIVRLHTGDPGQLSAEANLRAKPKARADDD
jgi:hypothetical protein